MIGVTVRMSGGDGVWSIVLHCNCLDCAHFYGMEAFQTWLDEHRVGLAFAVCGPYSGRVLYDSDGGTMTSEYDSLICVGETVDSILAQAI